VHLEAAVVRRQRRPSVRGVAHGYTRRNAVAAHIVLHLRDKTTKPATFRTLSYHLGLLLAVEATRDLATEQRPLALNQLLQDTAREWQMLAEAAEIRLRVKFAPRGHYVLGDERRLRWALGNVLDNAIKYSPPDTAVLIAGRVHLREPALAEIAIEDQGYGIAPADLPQVFTRFYRGEPLDARGNVLRRPGTGQGLYIAQRVIKAHGGAIAIASQLQRGTTVTIGLPLTAPVTLELPEAAETVRRLGIVDTVDLDDTRDIPVLSLLPIDREVDLL
jgi:signal transduction histidine kinase